MAYCLFILALTRTATGIIIKFLVSNSFELEGGQMKTSQSYEGDNQKENRSNYAKNKKKLRGSKKN